MRLNGWHADGGDRIVGDSEVQSQEKKLSRGFGRIKIKKREGI